MKYLLIIFAIMVVGCDVESLPTSDGNYSQNLPVKETLEGYDVKTTFVGETVGDDGTITQSYSIDIPVRHGKPIKSTWRGKIVAITDGDTFKVLNDQNEQVKIRLDSIDAPELGQPFGDAAKDKLAELIYKQTVVVSETGKDRDGVMLAFIELPVADGELDISREMIRMGYAWHNVIHSNSEDLAFDEQESRTEKGGLWAGAGPDDRVPPWEWRKRR